MSVTPAPRFERSLRDREQAVALPRTNVASMFIGRVSISCEEGVVMLQSSKIYLSGTSIVCLMLAGCAGGGLKNMFSRDDTAGYQTLEEIEAEEAGKPLDKTEIADATADEDKPRFASWLPFGASGWRVLQRVRKAS